MAAAASAAGPSTSRAPSSAPASANNVRSFSGRSGASRYAATAVSKAGPTGAATNPGSDLASCATTWPANSQSDAARPASPGATRQTSPPAWEATARPSCSPRGSKASAASPFSSCAATGPTSGSAASRTRPPDTAAGVGTGTAAWPGDLLEAAAQVVELEALEDGVDRLDREAVPTGGDELDQIVPERHVQDHRRELQRESRGLLVLLEQRAPLLGLDLVQARIQLVDRAELLEQLRGGLLADAGHAGDVVGRVALEADVVGDLGRRDSEALEHGGRRVDLDVGHTPTRAHHPDVLVDHLHGVPVAGDDDRADPLALGLFGQRAEDVVGLVPRLDEVGDAEPLHELGQERPLGGQPVGHVRTLGLVLLVELVAEGPLARVPGADDAGGPVLAHDLEQHLAEAEERVGRLSGLRRDGLGQREERPEREAAAVEQEQAVVEMRIGHAAILRHAAGEGRSYASPPGSPRPPRVSEKLTCHSGTPRSLRTLLLTFQNTPEPIALSLRQDREDLLVDLGAARHVQHFASAVRQPHLDLRAARPLVPRHETGILHPLQHPGYGVELPEELPRDVHGRGVSAVVLRMYRMARRSLLRPKREYSRSRALEMASLVCAMSNHSRKNSSMGSSSISGIAASDLDWPCGISPETRAPSPSGESEALTPFYGSCGRLPNGAPAALADGCDFGAPVDSPPAAPIHRREGPR